MLKKGDIRVSVIIPCRNEADHILSCLDSVCANDYPHHLLTVMVVDGMSLDGTREIITTCSERYSFIHLIDNENYTTPYALNLGIKNTEADIYIILSAHAEIDTDYIRRCVEVLSEAPAYVGCTGGFMEAVYYDELTRSISKAMSSSFGVGNAYFRTGQKEGYVDTVVFGAYKKEVFDIAGFFDESLARNQDDEFSYRLIKKGFKILLKREIHSRYHVRASFINLFKQYYQYGYWKVVVNCKHHTITTLRQLVPAFFVLFVTFGALLSLINMSFAIFFASVLAFYVILSFVSALRAAGNGEKIPDIMISYWILHISYGLGYWEGIWKIMVLGRQPAGRQKLTR
ncbi:MAG: glycosyltransferase family 2 protein [Bacteroidetes bacterium]|nr:glycosyltransferase family 2 protein [Bacteroidota bacterium]